MGDVPWGRAAPSLVPSLRHLQKGKGMFEGGS